jgi:glucose-6-phosphate isomerase
VTIRAADRLKISPTFDPSLDVRFLADVMGFSYGTGVFGPTPEYRFLNDIRQSLRDSHSTGPDPVYAIAMDIGRIEDLPELRKRMLLFGAVTYAEGKLGDEPVRSQGHVHTISPHCGWSTPELFEIWSGRAIIYGQEKSGDDPGRCVAVHAVPGDKVVIPPGWAHYVVNADVNSKLIFGAWCDREYGFGYTQMRAHHGLAWFPLVDSNGAITWERNPRYASSKLDSRRARAYPELNVPPAIPIYECFRRAPESVQWVSDPTSFEALWLAFEP